MGQKVHPESLRVGYIHDWKSNWFNERTSPTSCTRTRGSAKHIIGRLSHAGSVGHHDPQERERGRGQHPHGPPGIVIGKSGSEVDQLRRDLHRITGKQVKVNILEIKRPELDARLVAQSIAEQLQNRVAFRRAMKRALTSAMRSGAKGVKVQVSGRLGGAEMARTEGYSDGRVPLHTLRADIDYGFHEARTTFGRIGVKCWINKGEIMPEGYTGADLTIMDEPAPQAPERDGRRGGRDGRGGGGRGGGGGGRGGPGGPGGPGGRGGPVVVAARVVPAVAAAVPVAPAAPVADAAAAVAAEAVAAAVPVAVAAVVAAEAVAAAVPVAAAAVAAVAAAAVAAVVPVAAAAVAAVAAAAVAAVVPVAAAAVVAAGAAEAAHARVRQAVVADARSQARQAPQGSPWTPAWHVPRADQGPVRGVRPQGARRRVADEPSDRGRPYRHDPQDASVAARCGSTSIPTSHSRKKPRRDPDGVRQGVA